MIFNWKLNFNIFIGYAIHPLLLTLEIHPYTPIEDTPLILVDSNQSLNNFIREVLNEPDQIIAIDIEHHSTHSYRGFISLIQVSNRYPII